MRPRDNPFRAGRVDGLGYRFPDGVSAESLIAGLFRLGGRAAIVGPHGHGKSTLLRALATALLERGYDVRRATLRTESPRLAPEVAHGFLSNLTPQTMLLLDGAEQLSRPRWLHLRWRARHAGGLLITSHGAGLLPTLFECSTTPELLEELMRELTERQGATEPPAARALHLRHRGDLREALREAFDSMGSLGGHGAPGK